MKLQALAIAFVVTALLAAAAWGALRLGGGGISATKLTSRFAELDDRLARLEARLSDLERSRRQELDAGATRTASPSSESAPRAAAPVDAPETSDGVTLADLKAELADLRNRLRAIEPSGLLAQISDPKLPEEPPDFTAHLDVAPLWLDLDGKVTVGWSLSPERDRSGRGDWIGIYAVDSDNRSYKAYQMTTGDASGSVEIGVPGAPGEYEARYLTSGYTLVGAPSKRFTVVLHFTASLNAWPGQVAAGSSLTVAWAIHGAADRKGRNDWIGTFPVGADNGAYKTYVMTGGEPAGELELKAPPEAGDYEIRYLTGGGNFTVGSPIVISVLAAAR